MPSSPIIQLLYVFAAGGLLFALWKGGPAERTAALIVAANLAMGVVVSEFLAAQATGLRFVLDGSTAFALLAVALWRGAPWMGVVMLLYAGQFALHAYYLATGRDQRDYLHALINNIDFSAIIWCLIIGSAVAWRGRVTARRAAAGPPPGRAPAP